MFGKIPSAIPPGRMHKTDKVKGPDCTIPNERGVYRIRDKATGAICYVGQSDHLRQRAQQHARLGHFNPEKQTFEWSLARHDATKDNLLSTEKEHIKRHHPSGNTYAGGNGRR